MEIIRYAQCGDRQKYADGIGLCEWGAAEYLSSLLKNDDFQETLGGFAELFLLVDGDSIVSFITLSARDCIADTDLTPWLGFFYTSPKYRGNRCGKLVLDCACEFARSMGYRTVYLATDHTGLYEKYGFEYLKNQLDINGEDSRIYKREI